MSITDKPTECSFAMRGKDAERTCWMPLRCSLPARQSRSPFPKSGPSSCPAKDLHRQEQRVEVSLRVREKWWRNAPAGSGGATEYEVATPPELEASRVDMATPLVSTSVAGLYVMIGGTENSSAAQNPHEFPNFPPTRGSEWGNRTVIDRDHDIHERAATCKRTIITNGSNEATKEGRSVDLVSYPS